MGTRENCLGQGSSNEYPQYMFLTRNIQNIRIFILKLSVFGGEIFSIYLSRCVFVMPLYHPPLAVFRSITVLVGHFVDQDTAPDMVQFLSAKHC